MNFGFGFLGLEFGVLSTGLKILYLGFQVWGFRIGICNFGVCDFKFVVLVLGFGVRCLGFKVW